MTENAERTAISAQNSLKCSSNPSSNTVKQTLRYPVRLMTRRYIHVSERVGIIPAAVASCFDPSEGKEAFSYVFDLTGEILWNRPEQV